MIKTFLSFIAIFSVASTSIGSEKDALEITDIIKLRHLPHGTVLDPVYPSVTSKEIIAYTHVHDSAIWTGHLLAAVCWPAVFFRRTRRI